MSKSKLKKQVETNTQRMNQLMSMVRADVVRRTMNAKSIDDWMEELSPYIHEDPFRDGGLFSERMGEVVERIASAVTISKLPRGVNQSITKGVISECCYGYVTNMSRDMKTQMQKLAVETYNTPGETNRDLANKLVQSIDKMTNTRANVIARTETMRASNLANLVQARENGAKSYTVFCNNGACAYCTREYGAKEETVYDISDTVHFPPLHPRCRCTPSFSNRSVEELLERPGERASRVSERYVKPEPVKETKPKTPTESQIKTNLSQQEQYEYNKIPSEIEGWKKTIESFKDDKGIVELFEDKIAQAKARRKELTQKALSNSKVSTKPTSNKVTISSVDNFNLKTMAQETPLDEKTFNEMVKWGDKRLKNKNEYGYQFDTNTGKFVDNEIRGKKGRVSFQDKGEHIGSIHTHPPEQNSVGGGSFPSKQDIKAYRGQRGKDHYILSPNEVWYIRAEEQLGMGTVIFGQREIDEIYKKVYSEVTEKGQKLVREGKLKTDDASLREFMEKEIGDGLLSAFDTPEWREKGLIIRRAYR